MKHVSDFLVGLSLPEVPHGGPRTTCSPDLLHDLGADLPAGHLHLWGGPPGAGKTSFLLSLLLGAALRRRRVLYVTYHLPASSLALRFLGMTAGLDVEALRTGHLNEDQALRAAEGRECLAKLPIHIMEARGFSAASIEDRLVRMPFRAEVMAVDYLQAVVRQPGTEVGQTVRAFSSLASRLHVACVVALQATEEGAVDVGRLAARAGWIAPAGGSGLRRAEVIRNRYGDRSITPLRLDAGSGALERLP